MFTPELMIGICVQVVGLGIFIGMQKAGQANISSRLQRIEDKQDKHNEEIGNLRERVAVCESKIESKAKQVFNQ